MEKNLNSVLNEVLKSINPSKQEIDFVEASSKEFKEKIEKKIKSLRIDAEVFIGGSFAKNTMIKKNKYDVDVFLRFNKKYKEEEIILLTKRLLEDFKEVSTIHGSREYFQIKLKNDFFIELVPVIKIRKPDESKNITDLSYSHVRYIKKKIKQKKILDEIKITKAFCHASHCYGAESYINGFSGYSLELLVYYYGGFLKFIKAMIKIKEKTIIDLEKQFKNKQEILMDLNSSKLNSPIILIDPTYKQRNALAALSSETFLKFQKFCKNFLKNPDLKFFREQKIDLEKIFKDARKKGQEFILIEVKTEKQEGDVAGTKLFKFYKHLAYEINKFFDIKNQGFNYNEKKTARYFFVTKSKKEILINGPLAKDKKNSIAFKKAHKGNFIKNGKIYAKEKISFGIKKFIETWKIKNKKKIVDMSIENLRIIE